MPQEAEWKTTWRQSRGPWENADQCRPEITPKSQQTWALVVTRGALCRSGFCLHLVKAALWTTGALLDSDWGACSRGGGHTNQVGCCPCTDGSCDWKSHCSCIIPSIWAWPRYPADPTLAVQGALESLSQAASQWGDSAGEDSDAFH